MGEETERELWLVLKVCRENRGLSQPAAAELIGVTQPVVSRWESGESAISEDTLAKVAAAYGVTIRQLLEEGLRGASTERQEAERSRAKWSAMPKARLAKLAATKEGLGQLLADLGGKQQVADLLGVSRQAVQQRARKLGVDLKKKAS